MTAAAAILLAALALSIPALVHLPNAWRPRKDVSDSTHCVRMTRGSESNTLTYWVADIRIFEDCLANDDLAVAKRP